MMISGETDQIDERLPSTTHKVELDGEGSNVRTRQRRPASDTLLAAASLVFAACTSYEVVPVTESESSGTVGELHASTGRDLPGSTEAGPGDDEVQTDGVETFTSLDEADAITSTSGSANENVPPITSDDVYLTRQGEPLLVSATDGLLKNDTGDDGETLTAVPQTVAQTTSGAVFQLRADGSFEYRPAPTLDWWGEETFEYSVTDGRGAGARGQARIVVSPTAIPLSAVAAGIGGFAIAGEEPGDDTGLVVSGAGDVNGDTLADLLVSASRLDTLGGDSDTGRSYVVFGKADGDLVSLDLVRRGMGGFSIDGIHENDFLGRVLGGAGDVNGDALADIILVANGEPERAYLIFGKTDGGSVSLTNIAQGGGGFAIDGEPDTITFGDSASKVGDLNADGLSDIIIGCQRTSLLTGTLNAGRSYVLFGRTNEDVIPLADVAAGIRGFAVDGIRESHEAGEVVRGAGDVNGDGVPDLIIAAPNVNEQASDVYIVFGRPDLQAVSLANVANGVGGFAILGEGIDDTARVVNGAGDVNGDGLGDIVIGAFEAPEGTESGRAYIVFGKTNGTRVLLDDAVQGRGGLALDAEGLEDNFGSSVSGAGDVNGDGLADIIIGARRVDPPTVDGTGGGRTYVIFGRRDWSSISLIDITRGIGGFTIDGELEIQESGESVSDAGDVNGDGFADVIIGAPVDEDDGFPGRAYVVFGGDFTLSATNLPGGLE